MDTACTAVITSREASLLSLLILKAAIIPSKMGTTAPARAVAEGTKKANTIETTIAPIQYFEFYFLLLKELLMLNVYVDLFPAWL